MEEVQERPMPSASRKLYGFEAGTEASKASLVYPAVANYLNPRQILNELDESLQYTKERAAHLAIDLVKLKTEMRVFLKQHLDEFTHKTMSHIERDME